MGPGKQANGIEQSHKSAKRLKEVTWVKRAGGVAWGIFSRYPKKSPFSCCTGLEEKGGRVVVPPQQNPVAGGLALQRSLIMAGLPTPSPFFCLPVSSGIHNAEHA